MKGLLLAPGACPPAWGASISFWLPGQAWGLLRLLGCRTFSPLAPLCLCGCLSPPPPPPPGARHLFPRLSDPFLSGEGMGRMTVGSNPYTCVC